MKDLAESRRCISWPILFTSASENYGGLRLKKNPNGALYVLCRRPAFHVDVRSSFYANKSIVGKVIFYSPFNNYGTSQKSEMHEIPNHETTRVHTEETREAQRILRRVKRNGTRHTLSLIHASTRSGSQARPPALMVTVTRAAAGRPHASSQYSSIVHTLTQNPHRIFLSSLWSKLVCAAWRETCSATMWLNSILTPSCAYGTISACNKV